MKEAKIRKLLEKRSRISEIQRCMTACSVVMSGLSNTYDVSCSTDGIRKEVLACLKNEILNKGNGVGYYDVISVHEKMFEYKNRVKMIKFAKGMLQDMISEYSAEMLKLKNEIENA